MKPETQKSKSNPIHFIQHCCHREDPKRGIVKFQPYPFQEALVGDWSEGRWSIVQKARQIGMSTILMQYAISQASLHERQNVVVITHNSSAASNLYRMTTMNYFSGERRIKFPNGSKIDIVGGALPYGCGESIDLLILDEAAYIYNMHEMWMRLFPMLSGGGMCIAASTGGSEPSWFSETLELAKRGKNSFVAQTIPWLAVPGRDGEWLRRQTAGLSTQQVNNEYICAAPV